MHIVLLCATRRGYLFLQQLVEISPQSDLTVFSFREETWEPPFFDDIRSLTLASQGRFYEAKQIGSPRWNQFWESTPADIMLVVSWRYRIPPTVYLRPHLGTFVFHDSLLPEYRGFSPTVWAIINGEDHTGVTLFEIAEEVDSGDIIDQKPIPIGPDDTIADVMERVTQGYLDLLTPNLHKLMDGSVVRHPQDHSRATYTCKRIPEDNQIDWTASCRSIYNLIRGVSRPYPGAYMYLSGKKLRIWSAKPIPEIRRYVGRIPGRVVEVYPGVGSVVLAGEGALLLTRVQIEGDNVICAADLLNSIAQTLGR